MTHAQAVGPLLLPVVRLSLGPQAPTILLRCPPPRRPQRGLGACRRTVRIPTVTGTTEKKRHATSRTDPTSQLLHGATRRPPRTGRGDAECVIHGIGSDELDVVPRGVEGQLRAAPFFGARYPTTTATPRGPTNLPPWAGSLRCRENPRDILRSARSRARASRRSLPLMAYASSVHYSSVCCSALQVVAKALSLKLHLKHRPNCR